MSTVVSRRTRIVSSNPPRVAAALAAHPCGRVVIPFVFTIAKQSGHRAQVLRTTMLLNSLYDCFPHEGAAASQSRAGIDLTDDCLVELNVHPHVCIWAQIFTMTD